MTMLTADKLSLRVADRLLLDDVSLSLEPGSVLAVLGENGAGKTSLLRMLAGELQPDGGAVELLGKPLSQWSAETRAQKLAVLPQQSTLNFPFSVEEVVALGRYPHATGAERDRQIVSESLAAVDITHLQQRCYTRLSGGEKQRVHLARVLAQVWQEDGDAARFLLLDEPTAALDLAHQHSVLKVARSVARQGVGVLVILHDLNLAAHYADQLLLLKQGRLLASGAPRHVLNEENIRRCFGVTVTVMDHPSSDRPLLVYQDDQ